MRSEVSAQSSSGAGSSSSSSSSGSGSSSSGSVSSSGSGRCRARCRFRARRFFFGFEAGVEAGAALDDTSRVVPDQDVGLVVQHEVLVTAHEQGGREDGADDAEEAEIGALETSETSTVPSQDCRRKRRFVTESFKKVE